MNKARSFSALTLCWLIIMAVLNGCSTVPPIEVESKFETVGLESEEKSNNIKEEDLSEDALGVREKPKALSQFEVNPERGSFERYDIAVPADDTKTVTVSFEDYPLSAFIEYSLTEILKTDFVIQAESIASEQDRAVTLSLASPVSVQQYYEIFAEILASHGLYLRSRDGVLFVVGEEVQTGIPRYQFSFGRQKRDVPYSAGFPLFHFVPILYIDHKEVLSFLARLSNVNFETTPDKSMIGLLGDRQDILLALDLIYFIDRPQLIGRVVDYIPLEYMSSGDFAGQISQLLEQEGVSVDTALGITVLERKNSVVVHAIDREILDRVHYWRELLDTPEATDDSQFFIYKPLNVEAAKLLKVLSAITQNMSSSGVAGTSETGTGQPTTQTATASSGSRSTRGGVGASRSEELKVVVDENLNALIIFTKPTRYRAILPLLKQLDVTPAQVLIEARMIEVTLTDQFSQGIDWTLFAGESRRAQGFSRVTSFTGDAFSYTVSGMDYSAAISFLENQDQIRVLSSPRLVVAAGENATLNVGTDIPVLTNQSTDVDTEVVLQAVQYRSTGVDLSIKPTVSGQNWIGLEVSQGISETSENATSNLDSPVILTRSVSTSVFARSGQSIVIGGLIRENNSLGKQGVPGLKDVPILGNVFSTKSDSVSRTELLVIITPRILRNASDLSEMREIMMEGFSR